MSFFHLSDEGTKQPRVIADLCCLPHEILSLNFNAWVLPPAPPQQASLSAHGGGDPNKNSSAGSRCFVTQPLFIQQATVKWIFRGPCGRQRQWVIGWGTNPSSCSDVVMLTWKTQVSLRPVCWLTAVLSRTRLPELSMLTSLVPELASQSLLNSTLFQQYLHHSINSAFASLHSGLCEQQSLEQSESLHAMADGGQDLPSMHECLAFISQQTHSIHTHECTHVGPPHVPSGVDVGVFGDWYIFCYCLLSLMSR